jgi:enamine deaminase RidA (YjgF/YER057c/UK114 family)
MKRVWQLGLPEERSFGFAQAVGVGETVYVSGQVGTDGDDRPPDIESQMRIAYQRIVRILHAAGATIDDVVDETIFVTDLASAGAAARAVRREFYGDAPSVASTFIGINAIGNPNAAVRLLVEIKCTAVVNSARAT